MLKFLLEKEFIQIRRNEFLPRVIVILPFMMLLILPLAANFEIKNINLGIVDHSHSTYSQRLINTILASGYFRLADVQSSYESALRGIELDKADIVLEIPESFEKDMYRGDVGKVLVSTNTVNGAKGGLGSAFLGRAINGFADEIRSERMGIAKVTPQSGAVSIIPQFRYNPLLLYPVFMVPALMVMIMAMICGFLPALNIVSEKESGTIEQINVTPVRRRTFILAKLIPYWVIGFVVLTICFVVARLIYGLIPLGNIFTIYLFASMFVLAFSGFGLVISNFAQSIQQAMFMMFFVVITFVLMSGLYTPVASMPDWAQRISDFSPLKYFILTMRAVYLRGSGFMDLLPQFGALCGFAVFFNGLAVLTYKKTN